MGRLFRYVIFDPFMTLSYTKLGWNIHPSDEENDVEMNGMTFPSACLVQMLLTFRPASGKPCNASQYVYYYIIMTYNQLNYTATPIHGNKAGPSQPSLSAAGKQTILLTSFLALIDLIS